MNWNGLELPDNPYYQDDAVVIYYADCRFILPKLPKVDLVLTDPPYAITRRKKLDKYAETASLSADVVWRNRIKDFFRKHTDNILWLDYCAPVITGFGRKKLWLLLPGGYRNVRVLSWLKREMKPLL